MSRKSYFMLGSLCLVISLLFSCAGTVMKADIKMRQESYDEATSLYREYLAEHPAAFRIRSRLGFALLKTGRLDDAIAEFENVLETEPGDPYSVLYLGMAYLNKEEIDKAVGIWQGYRNKTQPRIEAEITRFLTLLQIADSQRKAREALSKEEELMTVQPDTNTVAVCYYDDLSPDKSLGAFQKGLAAMIITDLSKVRSLKIVERIQMQALLEEMKLGQTGIVDEATAPRLGRLLRAENLIVGSLMPGSIQATTSVTSATKGSVNAAITVSVEQEKFYELSMNIVQGVTRAMNIELSPEEKAAIGVPQTTNYKAFIYFGEALDALDAGDWKKAKDLFAKAVEADPQFDMARDGRDACPEIWLPNISDLGDMAGTQISEKAESSVSNAAIEQKETDELAKPGEADPGIPGEAEATPEIAIQQIDKDTKPIYIIDEAPVEAPRFPPPPEDKL